MRVKLDLSEFVEDERKFSVVKVNVKESLTVRDVLDKICTRFNVPLGDPDGAGQNKLAVGLFEDEFYVHPDETSTVLQETGVLKLRSLPKKGSSAAEGKKKKKGKKGTSEEEVPHSDGEKKTRKSRRGKVDEEIQLQDSIKEEKKEKRSRLSEELIPVENEDDDNRKVRKRKRGKTFEETSEMEMEVLEVKEQRKHKRSKTSEERVDSEEEVHVRGRGRREKLTDKLVEPQVLGEIVKGKKKSKKDKASESQVETEHEVEEVPVKEKKKRKKEKLVESVSEEDVRKDNKKKKSRSEEQVVLEKKINRKKMRKNSTDDDCEVPRACETDKKRSKWQDEKSSQEKEVSTSTVINLESEETSDDGNSSDVSRNYDKQARFSTKSNDEEGDHYAADSVTGSLDLTNFDSPITKKKRKRKHHKGGRAQKEDKYDSYPVRYIPSEETPVFSTSSDSKHNLPYPKPRNKKPLLNSNFTQRKHIHFASEDEKEVSSAVKDDMESAHEIEIVETTPRTSRRNETKSGFAGQSPNHNFMDGIKTSPISNKSGANFDESFSTKLRKEGSFFHSSPFAKKAPDVVEVEGEGAGSYSGEGSSLYNIAGRSPLNRGKNINFEQLATLDRIRKNKTITVCKVDSRKEQTNAKPREPPVSTTASPFRSPPPVFASPKPINDECKQTFHNLMTIKSRTVPLVFPNTRAIQRDSRTDVQREEDVHYYSPYVSNRAAYNNSFPNGNRSVGGQDFPSSTPQKMSPGKRESSVISQNYSYEMEENMELDQNPHQSSYKGPISDSPPGTSKWVTVTDESVNQRVGISQPKRKDRQAVHSPIGATLLKLRKQTEGGTDAGELQVLSNDEADTVSQDEISEATYGKESNAEEMRKSHELYNLAEINTSTRKSLMSGQVNGKTLMATPTKIDNEVVDLESDEDEIPANKSTASRMDTNAKVMERDEITADPAAEIVTKNQKNDGLNTKSTENNKDNVSTAEIILDKKSTGLNAKVVEDHKKTSIATEIILVNKKRVDSIADVVENNEKSTNLSSDCIDDDDDDEDYYDDIIEDEDDLGDFDAEIIEDKDETGGSVGKIRENCEKDSDAPASAAPVVHRVEIDKTAVKEAITEKLKEDLQKEVKQSPGKVMGQGGPSEAYFEKFPIMKVPPKVGEFIAVKLLSLDESYCPVYSNYLQARVINVNGLKVTLKYVDKIKSTKELEAKENVEEVDLTFEDEEVDLTEDALDKNAVVEELDWRDICEPRLIFP